MQFIFDDHQRTIKIKRSLNRNLKNVVREDINTSRCSMIPLIDWKKVPRDSLKELLVAQALKNYISSYSNIQLTTYVGLYVKCCNHFWFFKKKKKMVSGIFPEAISDVTALVGNRKEKDLENKVIIVYKKRQFLFN